jgi:hypothetical protein
LAGLIIGHGCTQTVTDLASNKCGSSGFKEVGFERTTVRVVEKLTAMHDGQKAGTVVPLERFYPTNPPRATNVEHLCVSVKNRVVTAQPIVHFSPQRHKDSKKLEENLVVVKL